MMQICVVPMATLAENILGSRGGLSRNNLLSLLENVNDIDTTILQTSESPYIDIDHLHSFLNDYKNKFTILNLNIQSLNAKYDVFCALLHDLASTGFYFSVINIQETWVTNKEDIKHFLIPEYNAVALQATCSSHSGLVTYIHKKFQFVNLELYKQSQLWEGIFLEVYGGGLQKRITICNIYRPPRDRNTDIEYFIREISPLLNQISSSENDALFCGDINIDLLKIESRSTYSAYFEMLMSFYFIPTITLPTRLSRRGATLIDHIFHKSPRNTPANCGIILSSISDHLMTFISLNTITEKVLPPKTFTFQKCDALSMMNFADAVENINLYNKLDTSSDANPNSNYEIIKSNITELMDKHLPVNTVKFNKHKHKHQPWITLGIIRSIKSRDKLYHKLKCCKPDSTQYNKNKVNLCTFNKILKKTIRSAKYSYYNNLFMKYKNDSKKTWSVINTLVGSSKCKKNISNLFVINNHSISNHAEIAEHFNSFFASIGTQQAAKIPFIPGISYNNFLLNPTDCVFQFSPVSEEDISKIISNFKPKSSTGIDKISLKLIKQIQPFLIPSLTLIVNQSLSTGIFPDALKIARIIPLYKKDSMSSVNNYRPISLLPCFSKIFEKVVHNQLYTYFHSNNLLYLHQYGFRKLHSTESATLEFTDRILNLLDNNKTPFSIFIDLSKAFDTLDHNILLSKLSFYGIRNITLKWFESYLGNRFHLVDFCGSQSSIKSVSIGVPQGSILGPLLFLIYVNDISNVSPYFNAILYADDTTLTSTLCCFNDNLSNLNCSDSINIELNKIFEWLCCNKLSLNIGKTKYMAFHAPQKPLKESDYLSLKINDIPIERCTEFNFLGTIVNDTMNWKPHVSYLCKKLSRTVGILRKLKNMLPTNILLTIYNSLFQSYLHQNVLVWGHVQSRIFQIQKKAIRVVNNAKYNAHTDPLFKKNNLLKFPDLYKVACIKFYHKYKTNQLPHYLNTLFDSNTLPHRYETRFNNVRPQVSNKVYTSKCIRYIIPDIVRDLPANISEKYDTHSIPGLSNYAKKYYIDKYYQICTLPNCYVCNS